MRAVDGQALVARRPAHNQKGTLRGRTSEESSDQKDQGENTLWATRNISVVSGSVVVGVICFFFT